MNDIFEILYFFSYEEAKRFFKDSISWAIKLDFSDCFMETLYSNLGHTFRKLQ